MGSTFDKTGGASEAQYKKMSFAHLLFCTSLDLHYLCKEIPKRLKQ